MEKVYRHKSGKKEIVTIGNNNRGFYRLKYPYQGYTYISENVIEREFLEVPSSPKK